MALSPLWQRRLKIFWAQRRGRFSVLLLGIIFVLSLVANLLANDHPLLLDYNGHLYAPIIQNIPETTFGPDFLPTEADYTNPEVQAAINAHGWMLWPPIRYGPQSIAWDEVSAPAPPSPQHWLGTDENSRDVAARLLYGLRLSLCFGFLLTALASLIGIAAGAVQGYFGGLTDLLLQRVTEIFAGLPQFFLIIVLASLFAPGFFTLLFLLLAVSWMSLTGVVRAEFLRARTQDYVRAARALGLSDLQIMRRHILPNALVAVFSFLPFLLAESITILAGLDFLGFGMPPGTATLGELAAEARDNIDAPWLGITAVVALGGILLLLIFIGEAARDAFDPRRPRGLRPPGPPAGAERPQTPIILDQTS
jgi:microcin C transport system permease protein